jgi:hypothetical protein
MELGIRIVLKCSRFRLNSGQGIHHQQGRFLVQHPVPHGRTDAAFLACCIQEEDGGEYFDATC